MFVWEGIAPHGERRIVEVVFEADLLQPRAQPRGESALEQPAFVPLDELASLPLYPPVAGYLRAARKEGLQGGARYLGNMWRSMSKLEGWAQ